MICCLKSPKSSAKVVDGKLVLSFPNADTPVVWQMDLSSAKASALEVKSDKPEGPYALALKEPKGETTEIAVFTKKEDAVKGLIAASKAMESAQGKIQSAAITSETGTTTVITTPKKKGGWAGPILGIIMLIVLIIIWGVLSPQAPNSMQSTSAGSQNSASSNAIGVPLSADAFLQQSK